MSAPAKPLRANLRDEMPATAAFIDDLRDAFGAEDINPSIKGGMAGVPTFYARENGHEIGTPLDLAGRVVVRGDEMIINPLSKEDIERANRNRRR